MAYLVYGLIKVVIEIDEAGIGPDLAKDIAGDNAAGVFEKSSQDLEGLGTEVNRPAVLA